MHSIRRATLDDIEALTGLFEAYRAFYEQAPDASGARAFLSERMLADESVVFVADTSDARLVGFTQLYPSFSSTAMRRIFVLNDLFVSPDARGTGAGRSLLDAASAHAREAGAARLSLSTAIDNTVAQRLYEETGYARNTAFYTYDLNL